ncbi:MAG: helix-turn-helix transcriptional regulator [Lachnospiraceae bacterium]|nr:helix-turn-helix transcriptional regulator [Lachnospiraceae bacterium]
MNISDSKRFGEALRTRRKELRYTQAFLSEFSGFSVSFISDLERGKETAELGKALYLAQLLGLDVELIPRGGRS